MGHWRQFLDRDTMGAWDLGGQDRIVRIEKVKGVNLEARGGIAGGRKAKIHFAANKKGERPKPLIAGATVLGQIAAVLGDDDPVNWANKRVIIYPAKDRGAKGGQVDCVRVRPRAPAESAPTTEDSLSRPVDEEMRANQKEQAGDTSSSDAPIGTEEHDSAEAEDEMGGRL